MNSLPRLRNPAYLLFTVCAIAVGRASSAPVAPNPLSLLKDKSVLLVDPTYPTDYHHNPRVIITGKFRQMRDAVGFRLTEIQGVDTMTLPALDKYDIVVFNYFTKLELLETKPFGIAFKQWLAEGNHGCVGYHNTGSESLGEWNWYRDSVQSMRYIDHKDAAQQGTVHITTDPAVRALPVLDKLDAQYTGVDEWYSFDMPPQAAAAPTWGDCKVLYYMDENSVAHLTDKMGVHPTTWIREDARHNRYFYSIHIHSDEGANSDFFHSLLLRALEYVAGYQDPSALIRAKEENLPWRFIPVSGLSEFGVYRLGIKSGMAVNVFSAEGKSR